MQLFELVETSSRFQYSMMCPETMLPGLPITIAVATSSSAVAASSSAVAVTDQNADSEVDKLLKRSIRALPALAPLRTCHPPWAITCAACHMQKPWMLADEITLQSKIDAYNAVHEEGPRPCKKNMKGHSAKVGRQRKQETQRNGRGKRIKKDHCQSCVPGASASSEEEEGCVWWLEVLALWPWSSSISGNSCTIMPSSRSRGS